MKILAILQNQWFKDPAAVQQIYHRHPERRNDLIARFLFMGCLTGKRLQQAFGPLIDRIVWEEASPRVGGHSGSVFDADPVHLAAAIAKHQPQLILCFGRVAGDGIRAMQIDPAITVLYGPHPAACQNPMPALKSLASQVERLILQSGVVEHELHTQTV
jgi:hypothetical protein